MGSQLGELLFEARDRLGLTLRIAAEKASIAMSYLCELEQNRKLPSDPVLRRLCNVLGINLEDANCRLGRVPGDILEKLQDVESRKLVRSVLGLKQKTS